MSRGEHSSVSRRVNGQGNGEKDRSKGAMLEEPLQGMRRRVRRIRKVWGKISFQDKLIGNGVVNDKQCCNDLWSFWR